MGRAPTVDEWAGSMDMAVKELKTDIMRLAGAVELAEALGRHQLHAQCRARVADEGEYWRR